jgi:hypothetical protein
MFESASLVDDFPVQPRVVADEELTEMMQADLARDAEQIQQSLEDDLDLDAARIDLLNSGEIRTEPSPPESDQAGTPFPTPITVSCVTKAKGPLTKIMTIDPTTGELVKDGSECSMSEGFIMQITVRSLDGFQRMLRSRTENQALVHGVSQHKKAKVVTVPKIGKVPAMQDGLPVIARSKDFIAYTDSPTAMLLDHDKAKEDSVGSAAARASYLPEALLEILATVHPDLAKAGYVATPATSACIYDSAGNMLRGEGTGSHTYIFPMRGTDIPRYLAVLGKRLFLAGLGRIEISRSGQLLLRTLVDLTVGSPERLDFVAGAVCRNGLVQRLPPPTVRNGGFVDTTTLLDLTPEEEQQYLTIVQELKNEAQPQKEKVSAEYVEQSAAKLVKDGITLEDARSIVVSRQNHVLQDNDLLHFNGKIGAVTVGEVLDNGPAYDRKSTADPLEPEYEGGSKTKAKFFWNDGNPIVHSYAHGSIKYRFQRYAEQYRPTKERGESAGSKVVNPSELLGGFEVTNRYVEKLGNEKSLYSNLLLSRHVLTVIALSGGGKTTFFFYYVAPKLADEGLTVYYVDADSPASEHRQMKEVADKHGFKFLNPDANPGTSMEGILKTFQEIADSTADLDGWVIFFDTLKKCADLMSKASVKEFYKLARKLAGRGATIVLLGHANKFRDKDGNLVFEGVGDVRSDTDELIFFERVKSPNGGLDITTVVDPDKGAKVRGIFQPFSFHISEQREITFYKDPLPTIDFSATAKPKATDEEVVEAARSYLRQTRKPVLQKTLVQHVADMTCTGEKRVREIMVRNADPKDATHYRVSIPFVFFLGERNAHYYELKPE